MIIKNKTNKIYSRIISTVPSQTELLSYLQLDDRIIGLTKFCIHPDYLFKKTPRIGGTKNLNIKKIINLNPDLVIANKEENNKDQIEAIAQFTDVYVSDVSNINEALKMISDIGGLTQKEKHASELIHEITQLQKKLIISKKITCIYLIWKDPFMTIGGDTFISDMMRQSGFINMYNDQKRYPELSLNDINDINPQVVFLSSEPYPFKQNHINQLSVAIPNAHVLLVDGEMFSWYGDRIVKSLHYLYNLNHRINDSIL